MIQVREINLLRESNLQLREENKHNFEESQACFKLLELQWCMGSFAYQLQSFS